MENLNAAKSRIEALEARVTAIETAVKGELDNEVTDAANMDTSDLTPKVKRKKPE